MSEHSCDFKVADFAVFYEVGLVSFPKVNWISRQELLLVLHTAISTPVELEHPSKRRQLLNICLGQVWMLHHCSNDLRHEGWVLAVEEVETDAKRFGDGGELLGGKVLVWLGLVIEEPSNELFSCLLKP